MDSLNFSEIEIDNLYKRIGSNVKYFRTQKGITQLELSLEMGYRSVSLVSAAELYTNKKHFNLEHLYKISQVLDISMCSFLEPINSIQN
jgi:transcriptional regulator with XRE-family HTH domain